MTASELIEELRKYPPDTIVEYATMFDEGDIPPAKKLCLFDCERVRYSRGKKLLISDE